MGQEERIARITLPTASFALTVPHVRWIAAEAKRQTAERRRVDPTAKAVSKSEIVRALIDRAMATPAACEGCAA